MSMKTPKQPMIMRLLEPKMLLKGTAVDDVHKETAVMLTAEQRSEEAR